MAFTSLDQFGSKDQFGSSPSNSSSQTSIKGFSVHSDLIAGMTSGTTEEKIGTISDVITDSMGNAQYIVIDLGHTPSGRKVMLPAERARVDMEHQCVYASALTRQEAEQLPVFNSRQGL